MSFRPNTTTSSTQLAAFIGVGANQPSWAGSERQTIERVVPLLQQLSSSPLALSSLYVTQPVDCPPDSPDFVNAVAQIQVSNTQSPLKLLDKLQELEKHFGRQRNEHTNTVVNGPRPLDLDLIYFGGIALVSERLTLPHPRAKDRLFVLEPLAELVTRLDLGASTENISELIQQLR
ncbi:MAG: 2-amino-4-hydroxy-6-hydroxymethyldihydropteridine diphosphokinase [Pseudohongiellaceae bacterium]